MTHKPDSSKSSSRFSFADYRVLATSLYKWSAQRTRASAVYAILAACLDVAALVALVPLVTMALGGHPSGVSRQILQRLAGIGFVDQTGQLIGTFCLFILVMALRSWVTYRRDLTSLSLQTAYTAYLQKSVMTALARAAWRDVEALRHARITQALGAEILRAASVAQQAMQILGAAILLVLQWFLALILAPIIALAIAVICVIGALAFAKALLRTSAIGAEINERNLSLVHIAQQFLGGLKLAKAQNAETGFTREFERLTVEMMDIRLGYQSRQTRLRQALTFTAAAAAGLMLVIGKVTGFDAGHLFAAFAVLMRVSAAATTLVQLLQQISSAIPSHSYLMRLIDELKSYDSTQESGKSSAKPVALPPVTKKSALIQLDHVTYRTGTVDRVRDISFAIHAGDVVALSGESGAGKSTTVDLISGLLMPSEGVVYVHGTPLNNANGQVWRERLAYVTQETWLINDTIRANLTWAREDAPDKELMWALDIVDATGLVEASEAGLNTIVNERGSRFSGGERQRLSLARAVLRRPELLILDEATNALDPEAEQIVFKRILDALPDLTIIVIAHRPSTLALCNRTIGLQRGQIL